MTNLQIFKRWMEEIQNDSEYSQAYIYRREAAGDILASKPEDYLKKVFSLLGMTF